MDAPEAKRRKARADDTVEPVFFHNMPETFYTELLTAFNILASSTAALERAHTPLLATARRFPTSALPSTRSTPHA